VQLMAEQKFRRE